MTVTQACTKIAYLTKREARRALRTAQAARDSGVQTRRECRYRGLGESAPPFRAERKSIPLPLRVVAPYIQATGGPMSAPIPDPETPLTRAIDSRDGSLMGGVFFIPTLADPNAPTVAELDAGIHLGYGRPGSDVRQNENDSQEEA